MKAQDGVPAILLGRRIEELRRAKNLTKVELAQKAGIHPTYVGKVENARLGRRLSVNVITRLGRALGADVDELLKIAGRDDPVVLHRRIAELERRIRELTGGNS